MLRRQRRMPLVSRIPEGYSVTVAIIQGPLVRILLTLISFVVLISTLSPCNFHRFSLFVS